MIAIAGWPLRDLTLSDLARLLEESGETGGIAELPKDLMDTVSIKDLFEVTSRLDRQISLAGTTDFANAAGLCWPDYQRYLAIQYAGAKFLGCVMIRVFLQAETEETLEVALRRAIKWAALNPEIETIVETHGGAESSLAGFETCILNSPLRFVVDFANISDADLVERILDGGLSDRIAYFHVRNLGDYREAAHLQPLEARAMTAYPLHSFLWEPKAVSGHNAARLFIGYRACIAPVARPDRRRI